MKLHLNKIIALFFFITIALQSTFAQQGKTKLFENYLNEYLTNKKVPSISAGVLRDDKIVWLDAKGKADLEEDVPAIINSVYRIASITKPITAVAIMQLYEKGLIDLDKDIHILFPVQNLMCRMQILLWIHLLMNKNFCCQIHLPYNF